MWGTPFDLSMLDEDVIILCPEEKLASELMELLAAHGVEWDTGPIMSNESNNWCHAREKTCYRLHNKRLGFSAKSYYEDERFFRNYIKCTFWGIEESVFDVASDDELCSLLGI